MSFMGNLHGRIAYKNHTEGKMAKAKEEYEKAMKAGCKMPEIVGGFGALLLREGEFQRSLELFDRALAVKFNKKSKDKLRSLIRMNRAIAYMKMGMMDKARIALEDLDANFPQSRVYQTLGYYYIVVGELEKAREYNLKALEYDDKDPVILDNMGQTYYELGDCEQAKTYFEKAYEQKQDQADILYHMGLMRKREGMSAEALDFFKRALERPITALNDVTREMLQQQIDELEPAQPPEEATESPEEASEPREEDKP